MLMLTEFSFKNFLRDFWKFLEYVKDSVGCYYRLLIGSGIWLTKWRHFHWPWVTFSCC